MKTCKVHIRTLYGQQDAIFYKDVVIPENLTRGDMIIIDGMGMQIKSFSYDTKSTILYLYVEDFHCPSKMFEDKSWKKFR